LHTSLNLTAIQLPQNYAQKKLCINTFLHHHNNFKMLQIQIRICRFLRFYMVALKCVIPNKLSLPENELMTISYNWLCEYLPAEIKAPPVALDPDKLSKILTSVGLEVESVSYSGVKGGLSGLIAGEVLTCIKHPDADKLKITTVSTGNETLQIVCGASNITAGQKVIVAPVGTIIYPTAGGEIAIKKAKIRGQESQGMICSEDEIGLGDDHSGIVVLPAETIPGPAVSTMFTLTDDYIYEIGLTPNRIDAMSHKCLPQPSL
jgi:phenylalanyl-tRNA synthetase beta chain